MEKEPKIPNREEATREFQIKVKTLETLRESLKDVKDRMYYALGGDGSQTFIHLGKEVPEGLRLRIDFFVNKFTEAEEDLRAELRKLLEEYLLRSR